MAIKEDSQFLQELESRLDSLFGEDTKPAKEKDPGAPQAGAEEATVAIKAEDAPKMEDVREIPVAREAGPEAEAAAGEPPMEDTLKMEDVREIPDIRETSREAEAAADEPPAQEQIPIAEIEKRFSEIFGEDDKAAREPEKPEDISLAAPFVPHASIEEIKSIVLSLEWEINDRILEQLEDEINKLYLSYMDNRTIQGLLRILRFAGRYLRVRGGSSHQDSVNLLLSVYDHLENIMVSQGMTEAEKRDRLIESIKQYRYWVERADLESPVGTTSPETPVDEIKPLEMEPSEDKFHEEQKKEETPPADISVDEEKPLSGATSAAEEPSLPEPGGEDTIALIKLDQDVPVQTQMPSPEETLPIVEPVIDQALAEEPSLPELEQMDTIALIVEEDTSPAETKPVSMEEMPPERNEDVERAFEAVKDLDLPPHAHEAVVCAMEVLKKTFQAEIDALKEEIRFLKNNR